MAWEGLWGGSSLNSELNVEKEPITQRAGKRGSQIEGTASAKAPGGGNELALLEEQKPAAALEWRIRREGAGPGRSGQWGQVRAKRGLASICGINEYQGRHPWALDGEQKGELKALDLGGFFSWCLC